MNRTDGAFHQGTGDIAGLVEADEFDIEAVASSEEARPLRVQDDVEADPRRKADADRPVTTRGARRRLRSGRGEQCGDRPMMNRMRVLVSMERA